VARCTVSDMKGATTSKSVVVQVGSPPLFHIRGAITCNSQPLADAVVRIVNKSNGYFDYVSYTDSDGTYEITNVPAGDYWVYPAKRNYSIEPSGFARPIPINSNDGVFNFIAAPSARTTTVVTNTKSIGPGSLCDALIYAVGHPGHKITFRISTSDPNYVNGRFVIHDATLDPESQRSLGTVPPIDADGTVIDGTTQPGYTGTPLIELNYGLAIFSANCIVKGLAIDRCLGDGIRLAGDRAQGNTIQRCWIGAGESVSNLPANTGNGISIYQGAHNNTIGGVEPDCGNIIAGNNGVGVALRDPGTTRSLGSENVLLLSQVFKRRF